MKKQAKLFTNKYPKFISKNDAIKNRKKIKKIFPLIGLKDFRTPLEIKAPTTKAILNALGRFARVALNENLPGHRYEFDEKGKIFFTRILGLIKDNPSIFQNKQGEFILPVTANIGFLYYRLSYYKPKNTPLLEIVNDFDNSAYYQASCPDLLNLLVKHSISSKKLSIVFSPNPWDIATMSMRGIKSCMRWSSKHAKSLVGSILDPCCGVIYLTDGVKKAKSKGENMLARAVVRFVYNKDGAIMIERVYLNEKYGLKDTIVRSHFKAAIEKALTKNYPVKTSWSSERIPMSKVISNLPTKFWSYRDSGICYKKMTLPKKLQSALS